MLVRTVQLLALLMTDANDMTLKELTEVPVPEVHNSSKAASNAASEPSGLQARTGRIFPSPDASTHRLGVRKLHETEGAPHLRSLHRCPRAMRSCPQSEVSAQASARFVHFEGLVLVVATMHND